MKKRYRVGVIGATKRGGYGHGLDTGWKGVSEAEIVAVADDDPAGLAAAVKRLGGRGHDDYRRMLEKERLDFVSICPRWITERALNQTRSLFSGPFSLPKSNPVPFLLPKRG